MHRVRVHTTHYDALILNRYRNSTETRAPRGPRVRDIHYGLQVLTFHIQYVHAVVFTLPGTHCKPLFATGTNDALQRPQGIAANRDVTLMNTCRIEC